MSAILLHVAFAQIGVEGGGVIVVDDVVILIRYTNKDIA